MRQRGVYVRETFRGIMSVRAVDHEGNTVRLITTVAEYFDQRDVDEMWRWLDRVNPPQLICLVGK